MEAIESEIFHSMLKSHKVWFDAKNENLFTNVQGQLSLRERELKNVSLKDTNISNVELLTCRFVNIEFEKCDFTNSILMESEFVGCVFKECTFVKALMQWVQAPHCEFSNCHLARAELGNANLFCASLSFSNLSATVFDTTDLRLVNWEGVRLRGTDITDSKVHNTKKFKVAQLDTVYAVNNDFSPNGDSSEIIQDTVQRLFHL